MMPRRGAPLRCLVLAVLVTGCASEQLVDRAYDGRVVEGRFIEPEAYASFLAGVMSESDGDLRSALASYTRAERLDPGGPEIWSRIAAVRCAANPSDARADQALSKAFAVDDRYASAWRVKAKCELARGDSSAAEAAALRAAQLESSMDARDVMSHVELRPSDDATRRRIIDITMTASNPATAFHALAVWAQAHDDVPLWSRALIALAKIGPSQRAFIARAAETLAGYGAVSEARAVAAAMIDAFDDPAPSGAQGLAARLALDEAIARRDTDALRRRAVRSRLGLDEAAGRALLSEDAETAHVLASEVARADPRDIGARLMLATREPRATIEVATSVRANAPPVSATVWVAFGTALARLAPPSLARSAMARIAHDPLVPGDECIVRAALALVSNEQAEAAALPPDGLVELRVLRGEPATEEGWSPPVPGSLDAIHTYLALAFAEPNEARTRELGDRLARILPEHRLVSVARSLILLASGSPIPPAAAKTLLARDPTDPLVAAIALRLAEKAGDADVARRARAAMKAIAGARADSVTE